MKHFSGLIAWHGPMTHIRFQLAVDNLQDTQPFLYSIVLRTLYIHSVIQRLHSVFCNFDVLYNHQPYRLETDLDNPRYSLVMMQERLRSFFAIHQKPFHNLPKHSLGITLNHVSMTRNQAVKVPRINPPHGCRKRRPVPRRENIPREPFVPRCRWRGR